MRLNEPFAFTLRDCNGTIYCSYHDINVVISTFVWYFLIRKKDLERSKEEITLNVG